MIPLRAGELRLLPLGGLGQIGMNCMALQQADGALLIDCGTSFPEDDYGVDVVHSELSVLEQLGSPLCGVFITHGHEDHIGGLPYLLKRFDIPVWGPAHALAMAERRLLEHGVSRSELQFHVAEPRQAYSVGPFEVEPVRVTHSIVQASALAIRTAAGLVVHSGDFKLDEHPSDGERTDIARLGELGDEGVRLLLSDSTNIDTQGRTLSEAEVAECLERLIRKEKKRVIVGLFASNIQRLLSLGRIARRTGRRICLLGRSLLNQVEVATQLGLLDWPSDLRIAPEQAQSFPSDELMVLAGGTQAEMGSSLYRLSRGDHYQLKLSPGDRVILSSRVIPGNERGVAKMHDDFLRLGVDLVTWRTERSVHASGHAARDEQADLIRLLKPRAFMPVHGTLSHLRQHEKLAEELGVEQRIITENGQAVRLDPDRLALDETFPHGIVNVGYGGGVVDAESLRRRRELGRGGVLFASVALKDNLQVIGEPSVSARGVPSLDLHPQLLENLGKEMLRTIRELKKRRRGDVEGELNRALRRRVEHEYGWKPRVLVHVLWS